MTDRSSKEPSLTYRDAGVDIEAGNELVESIKSITERTHRPGVLGGLGGFGGLFELPTGYEQPVLVSGTDGVGTKLKLAIELNQHDTIGIDLVAMCANDIIVTGAEPLYFLDYYATGKLDQNISHDIIKGIGRGCELAGIALIGGETAEMPDMYQVGDYDLAGFSVGIVEKNKIIDGSQVQPGHVLIGLSSSGPHSNGFSLIRKVISVSNTPLHMSFEGESLGDILLKPTRIYVKALLRLISKVAVRSVSHITGGGLIENLPRVLPKNTRAKINKSNWEIPPVFQWLQEKGNIAETEMLTTFNCGVGMVVVVSEDDVDTALSTLRQLGENAFVLGSVEKSAEEKPDVVFA